MAEALSASWSRRTQAREPQSRDGREEGQLVTIFTSMMLPRFEDTIFWKDLLSRFSFPLELFKKVVTSFLMASSMSGKAETGQRGEGG